MLLTIQEAINKVNKIDEVIGWLDSEWGHCKDEHVDILEDGSDLLKEYRKLILSTQIEL